ncbi:hypothetical protein Plhal703r1_c59g0164531 [Plasmopara halstedii]
MKDVYFDVTQIEINCALTAYKAGDARSKVVAKVEPILAIGSWRSISSVLARLKNFLIQSKHESLCYLSNLIIL